ncbi:hypothetical protein SAMN04488121_11372 [Chitinophaga filiformis]|uniref:Uncharacterized protein n=1 Tax=Chitinophaga filiformis TaxID=104663 RepID=A0A1G8CXG9_CHIFI|nr:hypothetical protein SAMN04488121_11372 [Chitinophaga filiformis]
MRLRIITEKSIAYFYAVIFTPTSRIRKVMIYSRCLFYTVLAPINKVVMINVIPLNTIVMICVIRHACNTRYTVISVPVSILIVPMNVAEMYDHADICVTKSLPSPVSKHRSAVSMRSRIFIRQRFYKSDQRFLLFWCEL